MSEILLSQQIWRFFQDCEKIYCANEDSRIIDLKEKNMCSKDGRFLDDSLIARFIDYVIVLEVLLLVGLIAKVSYDWYVFKHSGFLPIPASWIIYRGSSH